MSGVTARHPRRPPEQLAAAIRPAGYFNVKAERLRHLCRAYLQAAGLESLTAQGTAELRHWLLGIKGIGRETADGILLYVFERPVFGGCHTRRDVEAQWLRAITANNTLRMGMAN